MATNSSKRTTTATEDVKVKPANLRRPRPVLSERRHVALEMLEAEMELVAAGSEEVAGMFTPHSETFSTSLFDCLVESDEQLAERLLGWEV